MTTPRIQTSGTVAPDIDPHIDLGAEQGANPWDWAVFFAVVLIAFLYLGRRVLNRRRGAGCDGCGRADACDARRPPPPP